MVRANLGQTAELYTYNLGTSKAPEWLVSICWTSGSAGAYKREVIETILRGMQAQALKDAVSNLVHLASH